MSKDNREKHLTYLLIILLFYAAGSTLCAYSFNEKNLKLDAVLNYKLPDALTKLDTTFKKQEKIKDTIINIYQRSIVAAKTDTVFQKTVVDKTIDTTEKYADYKNDIFQSKKQLKIKQDSLKKFAQQIIYLAAALEKANQEKANLHIIVQDLDSIAYQNFMSTNKAEPNSVLLSAVKRKKYNKGILGFLSPKRNFFEATKLDSAGMVNAGSSYYISQTDDERNQVDLQARSAVNFGTFKASIGAGLEVKLSRFVVNIAWLGNPEYLRTFFARSAVSAGFRYNLKEFRFK